MKGKIILLLSALVLIAAGLTGYIEIRRYTDTHTWATVTIAGSGETQDAADAVYNQQECLKGDQIAVGSLTLEVTRIRTNGALSFTVKHGTLTDEDGNAIHNDVLYADEQKTYRTQGLTLSLCVTDHRFQ